MQEKANSTSAHQPTLASTLVGYSYSYVILFMISVEVIGLVMTYLLGISFHYDILTRTHCTVSKINVRLLAYCIYQ